MSKWTENFMMAIGFAAACIMIGSIIFESSGETDKKQYLTIESDYGGEILLDQKSGIRYLMTDNGMYMIE